MPKIMTPKEIAATLDGQEYEDYFEISPEIIRECQKAQCVIVYGASDDLTEMEGAITDEGGYGKLAFNRNGFVPDPDRDEREVLEKFEVLQQALSVNRVSFEAHWCKSPGGPSWEYTVPFPHETFKIMENGEVYCIGFVFKLSDAIK